MPDTHISPDSPPQRGGRFKPKGRQLDPQRLAAVGAMLAPYLDGQAPARDRLIEYLHILQDEAGYLGAADLAALAALMRLPMAEVWEVASFYDHFELVREAETPPPPRTIRVCTSLSCALAGSEEILTRLQAEAGADVRYVAAPCLGACDKAPAAADGHHLIECAEQDGLRARAEAAPAHKPLEGYTDFAAYC